MTYRVIDSIIELSDMAISAAEAHGMAVGMLCVDERMSSDSWLMELFPEIDRITGEERILLNTLFDQTRELLKSGGFDFDLFLPDDDFSLQQQADALRNWCAGFLFGIGYADSGSDWPGDSNEILHDIAEFTKLDSEVEGDDDDENALVELNEYIRAGVLLIQEELKDDYDSRQLH